MTDYELTKRNDIVGWKLRAYLIRVETDDLDFLNFMDKKLDELIDEFYRDDNNDWKKIWSRNFRKSRHNIW